MLQTCRTFFYQDPEHFEFLAAHPLPELIRDAGVGVHAPLMIWNPDCHTGEEAYTVAMFMAEFREQLPGLDFHYFILATDGLPEAIEHARTAVYPFSGIQRVPPAWKQKYLLRGRDSRKDFVRVAPEIRQVVRFRHLDFSVSESSFRERFHLVFARDVHLRGPLAGSGLLQRILSHMAPGGYLLHGRSSQLPAGVKGLASVGPGIFQKPP